MYNNKRIIVSFTSWAKRIATILPTIESIFSQSIQPDIVILNLSIDEFKNKEKDLPKNILDGIKKYDNFEIYWVDGINNRTFKKIIPTIKRFYGEDYYLLSIDDDILYKYDYIKTMVESLELSNSDVFCNHYNKNCVIGGRMIYRAKIFDKRLWEKLTDNIIQYAIDDEYYKHYIDQNNYKFLTENYSYLLEDYNGNYEALHDEYRKDNRIAKANMEINKVDFRKYRYSVITYLFNGYEKLKEILDYQKDVEYICVTDDNTIKSNTWKIVVDNKLIGMSPFDKVFYVRYHVWDYVTSDICVRFDASLELKHSLDDVIKNFTESGACIGLKPHPQRHCMLEEYFAWVKYRNYSQYDAENVLKFMSDNNLDIFGDKILIEQNIAIQRKCDLCKKIDGMTYSYLKFFGKNGNIDRLDQTIISFILYKYFRKHSYFVLYPNITSSNNIYFNQYTHDNKLYVVSNNSSYEPYFFNAKIERELLNKNLTFR